MNETGSVSADLLEFLDAAIAVTDADFGTIQLLDVKTGDLRFVAQRGFPQWWLDYWGDITDGIGASGTALQRGERVIVEDIEQSSVFAGQGLETHLKAGVRAVQATPLIGRSGRWLGMFSTHYKAPYRPDRRSELLLDMFARQAADIIEREEAQVALRQSEARYRTLVDATTAVTWSCPSSGLHVEPQHSWMAFTGQSAEEMLGAGWVDAVHPDDAPIAAGRWNEAVARGDVFSSEHRIRRHDGQWRWMSVTAVPLRNADGQIVEWFGMNLDVTERKVVELTLRGINVTLERYVSERTKALQESEQRLSLALSAARMGTFDWDFVTGKVVWSAEAERIWGLPEGGFQGTYEHWRSMVHPDDIEEAEALAQRASSEPAGSYDLEHRIVRPDGTVGWVLARTTTIRDESGRPVRMVGINMDITDRKEAEVQLKRLTTLLTETQRISNVGGWRVDLATGEGEWTPETYQVYGVPQDSVEVSNAVFLRLLHPADRPAMDEWRRKCLAGERPGEVEFRIVRPDGSVRTIVGDGELERSGPGSRSVLVGTVRDITERKRMEAALAESQRLLSQAQHAAHFGSWLWNFETGEVRWSPELYALYGLDPKTFTPVMSTFQQFVHPDDREAVEKRLATLSAQDGTVEVDFRIVRADGAVRVLWARGEIAGGHGGQPRVMSGISLDITERKSTEEALRKSEERFRLFMDNSPTAAWLKDDKGRYVYINRTYERLYGVRLDAMTRRTDAELFPPDIVEKFRRNDEAVLAADRPIEFIEESMTADGNRSTWLNTKFPFRDAAGRRYVAGIGLDITERKRAEAHAALLLQEVNHRSKNLLAVIQSVAQLTSGEAQPQEFYASFSSRLRGLAACQDLLVKTEWRGVSMRDLTKSQLPHLQPLFGSRVLIDGPDCELSPPAAQAIGMALHELGTNAAKYGALSTETGVVSLSWAVIDDLSKGGKRLSVKWTEQGGPPIEPPRRQGFGYTVSVEMPEHLLDAEVLLSFPPSGVVWILNGPMAKVCSKSYRMREDHPDAGRYH